MECDTEDEFEHIWGKYLFKFLRVLLLGHVVVVFHENDDCDSFILFLHSKKHILGLSEEYLKYFIVVICYLKVCIWALDVCLLVGDFVLKP